MIAGVAELPRNDQLAEQFELLADLMELEAAVGAARLLGMVHYHGRLVAARAEAWRYKG